MFPEDGDRDEHERKEGVSYGELTGIGSREERSFTMISIIPDSSAVFRPSEPPHYMIHNTIKYINLYKLYQLTSNIF